MPRDEVLLANIHVPDLIRQLESLNIQA